MGDYFVRMPDDEDRDKPEVQQPDRYGKAVLFFLLVLIVTWIKVKTR